LFASRAVFPQLLSLRQTRAIAAAHARSEGLTLVSNDIREFERVPALQLANWIFP
jgi:predicted nucleic acid-binding protein